MSRAQAGRACGGLLRVGGIRETSSSTSMAPSDPSSRMPCGCRNLPSGRETCTKCVPRVGMPLTLAAVGLLALAGVVAQRTRRSGSGSMTRPQDADYPERESDYPEMICICGMTESMHDSDSGLGHLFSAVPDRTPENPMGKTYGGHRPISARDLSRYGLAQGSAARASFSAPGKIAKATHPWFAFSVWQSSDHADRTAARVLSTLVGFDVMERYAEPGVDVWALDDEMEQILLRQYGRPPMSPESGPSIGRRPYRG